MIPTWVRGLLRRRAPALLAVTCGVAVAVALLASLGMFLAAAQGRMTARAVGGVGVDWQVQVQPGVDPAAVLAAVRAAPGTTAAVPVGFANTSGLAATTGGSTQTTGPGVALGLPPDYRQLFPEEIRPLVGATSGVLLAQQTAANLHVKPGDTVQVGRAALPPVDVRVAGVVDLPQADSLFQKVGAPAGSQPSAPPDNVVLLPRAQWQALFDPLNAARPDLVSTQVHAARDASALPSDPAAAYTDVTGAARNLEAASAGAAVVGDNLGAALGSAREDAAYARVLFLFLGLPGAVLAGLLTAAVTAAGAGRRRAEQALLRARGATVRQIVSLAAVEAALVGVTGCVLGLAGAALTGWLAFGAGGFGADRTAAAGWAGGGALVGLGIAALTVVVPAYGDARGTTVAAGRAAVGRVGAPRWARYGLDVTLLAAAGIVFWLISRTGYQLVLAPEGVPSISVSYWAFAGPALLWAGAGLLAWRLSDLTLGRGRRLVGRGLRPVAGRLAPTAAAMMARRRRPLARSVVLLGLALAFAASTAIFNATYRQQAEVDAQLTNGADVTVTEPPGATVEPGGAGPIAAVPGVRAVEPLQHRFAYVGADLQDLYGVRPNTITNATAVQDSYFQGGSARQLLGRLAAAPDSVLVSAETVKDFQLQPGDLVTLRLRDARTAALIPVPFHYVGVVSEFPTAPRDSFLVANASYVAQRTGSDAVGAFLVDTGGADSAAVAQRIRALVGTSATVTDIGGVRAQVGSSLTAVDLAGLTRVELAFALLLAAAAGGLVLAAGLAERRRTAAVISALGATARQLRGLVAGEAAVLTVGGLLAGVGIGWALSEMLVAVLRGVFDPPPDRIAVPWPYLVAAGATTVVALAAATTAASLRAGRRVVVAIREL